MPGARGGSSSSELMVTSKIERLPTKDMTPAPLPPSPAADAADVWFEQVPTNPAAIPDLDALNPSPNTSSAHIPATAPIRRMPPGKLGAGYSYDPSGTRSIGLPRPPWVLPALIAAICLVVGMVLGALLFADTSNADCKDEGKATKAKPDEKGKPGKAHEPDDSPRDKALQGKDKN